MEETTIGRLTSFLNDLIPGVHEVHLSLNPRAQYELCRELHNAAESEGSIVYQGGAAYPQREDTATVFYNGITIYMRSERG